MMTARTLAKVLDILFLSVFGVFWVWCIFTRHQDWAILSSVWFIWGGFSFAIHCAREELEN